ncbi:flagellar biosynthesis protein [Ideonella sp. A 288]|uniref:MinD/ParA family ATP-binding protein n=1 Tax=Ideonella sp. A 288 TaxID=1962181 RepID=UPI000B4BEE18|nr:flagellar biosynthesis protein [Ideonella sp. A 288]
MRSSPSHAAAPRDQAHGLRRMFAATRRRFVQLAHNPYAAYGGVGMERLCAAFAERQLHTLVVDAADTASPAHELASIDLSACIEPLSASVSFIAARGLPMRWLDARGSTAGFLAALGEAVPRADVVLVHASASDLARMFAGRTPRPVLLASDQPESLTHAYASMKLLTQRLGVMAFDLLLTSDGTRQRMARIAERLTGCADRFLGAALGEWAVADPSRGDGEPPDPGICRLAAAQLTGDEPCTPLQRPPGRIRPGLHAGEAN